ncbi:nitrite reductase (NO-forming) / hydroxylamine reductase [Halobiforma haloterrestris]|uniref:Nitrite reductase (NO-forming) / hydroxylamine reductase n=1 Tax=Natronobacterium haloterrestre TaxID=148448 RepID=A0A1I1IHT3_NATHA|nr:cytochrome D1 domain-containing protein [Halobiforma haloterrestris]SFC35836.1 nitrite reductase (NO-forming) / hydroxylamine reductase [Halobiforma haloterrestris]
MSESEHPSDDAKTTAERIERIKKAYAMRVDDAEEMGIDEQLDFPDWIDLDLPERRRFLAGTAAAGTAAVAGCMGDEEPTDGTETGDGEDSEGGSGGDEDAELYEFEMRAYQWGFEPQEIQVPEGAKVKIDFVESTFEENPDFNLHDWHLLEPYDEHVVLEEDTDPDSVSQSVEFIADEPGRHLYECTLYCGSGHAQMEGELFVGDEAAEFDYRKIEDVQTTHEILKEESELPQEPQLVDDLTDMFAVVERGNASVSYVDMENHEKLGRIEDVGHAIHVTEFHRDIPENEREGAYMYTMARDGYLYKLDLFGLNRVARVRVGTDARDLSLNRTNDYLIAGLYNPGQLFVVDADTMEPLKQITTKGIDLDGQFVESRVCALYDAPHYGVWVAALKELGQVWLIDYTQDDFPVVEQIDCARTLHDGFFTKDGRYFMLASQTDNVMSIIDLEERELVKNLEVGAVPHPGPGALDAERHRAFTTHIGDDVVAAWDTDTWELEKLIDVPGGGLFLRDHPDCDYIWCDVALRDDPELDQLVYAIDRETLEVAFEVETGSDHAIHPIFSNDGQEVFVSHWAEGEIHVYDSHTGEHIEEVEGDFTDCTGKFPMRRAEKFAMDWDA